MPRHINSDPIDVVFDSNDKSKIIYTSEAHASAPPMLSEKVALESILARYDYQLVNSTNQMRQFILANLFRLAENSEDEKTKLKTLETLGRVTEIGLFTNKIEIAIADKPTSDLEVELRGLLKNYAKTEKQVVEEISDEELRGYDQIEEDDLMGDSE